MTGKSAERLGERREAERHAAFARSPTPHHLPTPSAEHVPRQSGFAARASLCHRTPTRQAAVRCPRTTRSVLELRRLWRRFRTVTDPRHIQHLPPRSTSPHQRSRTACRWAETPCRRPPAARRWGQSGGRRRRRAAGTRRRHAGSHRRRRAGSHRRPAGAHRESGGAASTAPPRLAGAWQKVRVNLPPSARI